MKTCPACYHKNPDTALECAECQTPLTGSGKVEKTRLFDARDYDFSRGDIIGGRYHIVRELGRGGMGIVYLVEDDFMDDEQCALKLIHPELVRSQQALQRFRTEVSVSRKLRHPAIIQVFDMGNFEGRYYFTMEFIDGLNLSELLEQRQGNVPPFTLDEVRCIMRPLLDGLAYAHKKTIHRDIKPDNVMVLGEFPDIKINILDFGIARTMSSSRFTQTNQGLGAPHYMAPEQIKDAHSVDQRADLYGAGVILYEILTGKQAIGRFKSPSQLIAPAYAPLDKIVDTALATEPEERYPDAPAMLAALDKAIDQAEEHSSQEQEETEEEQPKAEPKKEQERVEGETTGPPEQDKKTPTGFPLRRYGLLAAAVAAIGLGTMFFLQSGPSGNGDSRSGSRVGQAASQQQQKPDPTAAQKREQEIAAELKICSQNLADHQWQQAHACFSEVLAKDSGNTAARNGLSRIFQEMLEQGRNELKNNQPKQAAALLTALQTLAGSDQAAGELTQALAGYKAGQIKKRKQAEQEAEQKRIAKEQQKITALLEKCGAMLGNQQWQAAYNCYADVLAQDSANATARAGLAGILQDLLSRGRERLANDNEEQAKNILATLHKLSGSDETVKKLEDAISSYEAEQERKHVQAEREAEQRRIRIAEEKKRIQDLLSQCERYLNSDALTTPADANAYTCYQQVLAADEGNEDALAGIAKIRDKYLGWGLDAVEQGNLDRAEQQLAKLEKITGSDQAINELQSKIAEKKEELARAKPKAGDTYTDPTTGMEFAHVPGGCFDMGDIFGEGDDDEKPVHKVCVDGFYLGKHEVTQGEWKNIFSTNPSRFKNDDNYPVEEVNWFEAAAYANKLSEKAGRTPCYELTSCIRTPGNGMQCTRDVPIKKHCNGYRLPFEAEWEFAARERGQKVRFGTGKDTIGPDESNFDARRKYKESYSRSGKYQKQTTPVDHFAPNSLGLHDMSGNVWEWCSDWYEKNYYKQGVRDNPRGSSMGSYRVGRGGGWYDGSRIVRSANRYFGEPGGRGGDLGFRLVLPGAAVGGQRAGGLIIKDNDQDGVVDRLDLCQGTKNGISVDKFGCPQNAKIVLLKGSSFFPGTAKLTASAKKKLDSVAKTLAHFPKMKLEVAGYTDNIGDASRNQHLSKIRAEAVLKYLVKTGAHIDQLIAKGYGERDPISPNDSPKGRAKNRRIELHKIQ